MQTTAFCVEVTECLQSREKYLSASKGCVKLITTNEESIICSLNVNVNARCLWPRRNHRAPQLGPPTNAIIYMSCHHGKRNKSRIIFRCVIRF